uniref:Vinculin n=1 Tax=Arion vulgaris TaxID=1028688 RepID=A0A0B7APE0_9EUPU
MPVFHTKTIESILEPVAQQVSRLVILHEEAEDGNAMPDLTPSVRVVKLAVDNLVKVGYDTISNSGDQILKQDMPPALRRVEESSQLLLDASEMLSTDPFSVPARKKLIEGSRGILQGTSSLLLTFDESEVREIIRVCRNVLEYLAITEVVDRMDDLVTFVKNLSPVLTKMTKEVDSREKELTHQVHRDMLIRSLEQVKVLTPVLISGIKIFITTIQSDQGTKEAQNNRDYTVRKMSDEIHEIIRVLQLTTYDEDEWDVDDITIMKKAQNAIEGKMKPAHDWLSDPAALVGSLGDKAVRQIIDDSKKIGERCAHPGDTDTILRSASDVESMVNSLSELKLQGKGSSPQAVSLSRGIQEKLKELQQQTAHGTIITERSGIRKPAPTVDGKVEQARQWLANPGLEDKGLGESATRLVINEGLKVANCCTGPQRQDLLRLCGESEVLTNQLVDLDKRGQGNGPQAKAIARNLDEKLGDLKVKIQDVLVSQVAEDFIGTDIPMTYLSEASLVLIGQPGRDENFESKVRQFQDHAVRLAETANSVATSGGCKNKQTVEDIFKSSSQLKDLTPQVIHAARVVFLNPNNQAAVENFNLLKKQWSENMTKVSSMVDEAMDSGALIHAQEAGILRDTEKVEEGIRAQDSERIFASASDIARRANRVLQVAEMEVQNSDDQTFVNRVKNAYVILSSAIPNEVESAAAVAMNTADVTAAANWRKNNQSLIDAVGGVKQVVAIQPQGDYYDDRFPPVPEFSQLHISGEEAPPRPPLPTDHFQDQVPQFPPPPETDDDEEAAFPLPQANQPIMMAAHSLHMETKQWSSKDNEIITAAKKMAIFMAKLSQIVRGEIGTKKDLIATAKTIAEASEEVTRLAKKLAAECTDKKMRMNLLNVCERIPTIATQLKILSTVKATMLGAQGSDEDQEATEMLVGNAQNLMQAVKETVRTTEAASIRIRVDSGYTIRWTRKRPWYM